jgi:hypothetical protein
MLVQIASRADLFISFCRLSDVDRLTGLHGPLGLSLTVLPK